MDVFATVITASGFILQFLDACGAYSDEAKSLKTRLDWDIRVLEGIGDYFAQRQAQKLNHPLEPEDAALLERTAEYLDGFLSKVQKTSRKIESKGWLRNGINRAVWVKRRADLQNMQREIFEWTKRFDVRVLGLPQEFRKVIPTASAGVGAKVPAVVKANNRLQEFLALTSKAKEMRVENMLLQNSGDLAAQITHRGDITFQPLRYEMEQLIFACRRVPQGRIPGTPEFENMVSDMGELAAALNCLDPAVDIRLLKVEYYFYHADSRQFLFAQKPPYPTTTMVTLEKMISGEPFPDVEAPLNERLKLAHKLAEAVFFLHTAGFLHKNITSSSVVALRRANVDAEEVLPELDDSYLMGFDLIRGSEAVTTQEGAVSESEEVRSIWDFDVFQHPDRLRGRDSPRYIKTYDVYSLGVILLEVGFWEPLETVAGALTREDPSGWAKVLSDLTPQISARAGERYQSLVAWCLNLKGDHIVKDTEFVQEVLDPLEDIVNALERENRL
ncbi:hypothetical protein BP5796_03614 [Coleophoma crateriformis]|uniref:Protein kinase domain-containing protein n=1 Tax=Coleophoma crateriformis TaxID=565419 RepID=A0A3D8SNN8_9HELO|nr:hypothetical protein BP5796_03614 [Coleophoma crateriformis]